MAYKDIFKKENLINAEAIVIYKSSKEDDMDVEKDVKAITMEIKNQGLNKMAYKDI